MSMHISNELKVIREVLSLTQEDLASIIGVSSDSVYRWENEKKEIEDNNIELIYNFAYSKGIFINKIYEQIMYEDCEKSGLKLLFHGAKNVINMPVDLQYSKENNDFGKGFYLGENFEQASTYIANTTSKYVYAFYLDTSDLKIIKFNVNTEWMLAIAYYRGWIIEYKDNNFIKEIIKKIEDADVIIAPIADNRMFDLISEFVDGSITNEQCEHALAATNLGSQYVIKTNKAINNLKFIKICFLSNNEKEEYKNKRLANNNSNLNKVKVARIEYRGKGQYIDEFLK